MTDPETLLADARAFGVMIATAESCTGGMVAARLTDTPGSSDVFERGFVTYSNAAKTQMLDVPADLIAEHGAVSEDVAHAMAAGALRHSNANLAVSITGVAGPGGSERKPEGMVCFGIATPARHQNGNPPVRPSRPGQCPRRKRRPRAQSFGRRLFADRII